MKFKFLPKKRSLHWICFAGLSEKIFFFLIYLEREIVAHAPQLIGKEWGLHLCIELGLWDCKRLINYYDHAIPQKRFFWLSTLWDVRGSTPVSEFWWSHFLLKLQKIITIHNSNRAFRTLHSNISIIWTCPWDEIWRKKLFKNCLNAQ